MPSRLPENKKPQAAMLGLAFDAEDGHKRITRGPNFLLAGGSQETHSRLQETAVKVNEQLSQKGKTLAEVSPQEFCDMVEQAIDR